MQPPSVTAPRQNPSQEPVLEQQTLSIVQTRFTHCEFARQVELFGKLLVRQMSPQPAPASGDAQKPLLLQNFEQHWALLVQLLLRGVQDDVPASARQIPLNVSHERLQHSEFDKHEPLIGWQVVA